MTPEDPGLRASQEALALLEGMMLRLYREKAKYHPTQYYAMFADPLVEEIRKIRAQIDEYIGLNEFDRATAEYDRLRSHDAPSANGTHPADSPAQTQAAG